MVSNTSVWPTLPPPLSVPAVGAVPVKPLTLIVAEADKLQKGKTTAPISVLVAQETTKLAFVL